MKQQQLSLSLRPKSFADLFGQQSVVKSIEQHVAGPRMATSWLFTGVPGTGKTSIALIMALSMQCSHAAFGYPCIECRRGKRSFNIEEQKAASLTSGATRAEALEDWLSTRKYTPSEGSLRRVYILDEPQSISGKGQDFLLDALEPKNAVETSVIILCTSQPAALSDAVRRRCFTHHMRTLSEENIEKYVAWVLQKVASKLDAKPLIDALFDAEICSPGFIVMACERYLTGLPAREAVQVQDANCGYNHKALTGAIRRGEWEAVREELKKATPEVAVSMQMGVAGFLRKILLDEEVGEMAVTLVKAIKAMSQPYPERMMLSVIAATTYEVTRMFARR